MRTKRYHTQKVDFFMKVPAQVQKALLLACSLERAGARIEVWPSDLTEVAKRTTAKKAIAVLNRASEVYLQGCV